MNTLADKSVVKGSEKANSRSSLVQKGQATQKKLDISKNKIFHILIDLLEDHDDASYDLLRNNIRSFVKARHEAVNRLNEKSLTNDLYEAFNSYKLWEQNSLSDYFESANIKSSAFQSLASDWENIGNDLWLSTARFAVKSQPKNE